MRYLLLTLSFMAGLSSAAVAKTMKLTIYDDGRSCPANCDAHVAINPADNGTRFAFDPGSSRGEPRKCSKDQDCRICFDENDSSCMTAVYRGGGPPAGTFDLTPAFYDAFCPRNDIPAALKSQCASLDRAVNRTGYDRALNCIAEPENSRCRTVLAKARAAREADIPKLERCLEIGEKRFNREQTDPKEQRALDCNYSLLRLGGPNKKGLRWQVLKPAACREGTFVGQHGTDCCSADVRFAASVAPECSPYYLK